MFFLKYLAVLSSPAGAAALWSFSAALIALVLWGTMAPVDPVPHIIPWQDKLEHLVAFFGIGLALCLAVPRRACWIVVLALSALAVGIEYGQALFTLHREFSWRDAGASVLGALIGAAVAFILLRADRERRAKSNGSGAAFARTNEKAANP